MHTKLRRFNGSRTAHHSLSSKGRSLLVKNIKERNYDSLKNSHLQQQQSALSLSHSSAYNSSHGLSITRTTISPPQNPSILYRQT
jgi:hypothetical protein